MKKVLITGANSYIGGAFLNWAEKNYPEQFEINVLDMIDGNWRKKSFSGYDAVFHVAGIAHADIGKISEEQKKFYYQVNRDLAIETAMKAKMNGVKQFVFMSSIIIYGGSTGMGKKRIITKETEPQPDNFYGDSKWQADQEVRKLEKESFHVAVLRPPMIYGKGCKGNYSTLEKIAKRFPVFPNIQNERSMLYIDNFCEFLCLLMKKGSGGIYFPQNEEYVKTSDMVKKIAEVYGHRIWITKLFNPVIWMIGKLPGKSAELIDKAFGSLVYDKALSEYKGMNYNIRDLEESVNAACRNK